MDSPVKPANDEEEEHRAAFGLQDDFST